MTKDDRRRLGLYMDIKKRCKRSDSVLEIGCGNGKGLARKGPPMIAGKVKDYVAIDKKKYNNPPFKFIHGDFFRFAFSKYDRVIALYVTQYVEPEKFFRRVSKLLKFGGTAYFSEGLAWVEGGEKLKAGEICRKFRETLPFRNVEIFGLVDGVIVLEEEAKTGVFVIASN